MTSLNFEKIKDQISNWHKFCLIVYKNNVIRIKIVEIMALFRVFLDHPSYSLVTSRQIAICLLKMTLEHSSVSYFQVILAQFQWWLYFC